MTTAIIVAGGDPVPTDVLDDLPEVAWVIAADSGADHAMRLGLPVDVIVGDMDSISPTALDANLEVEIHVHPVDKDATDLELALELVNAREDVDRLIVIGGTGGRIDHFLANATVLASPRLADLAIEWIVPPGRVTVVHHHARVHGDSGSHISLIPLNGDAVGITTVGMRWGLEDATIPFGSSRGVSNEMVAGVATISLRSGVLLVVQPMA